MRANFSYMDDAGRAIEGYSWLFDFNRISSSMLGFALNTNLKLSDISPLPQLIAIVMLSVTSVLIMRAFYRERISYSILVASCLIGVTPFAYGCWVFKFDAPCMALSLLVSAMPLMFWSKLEQYSRIKKFVALSASVVCMLIMWTSYQASSGVVIVLVLGLASLNVLQGQSVKLVGQKTMFYAFAYLLGGLAFKIVFPDTNGSAYRETTVLPASEIVSGILNNVQNLFVTIANSINVYWAVFLGLIVCCYIVVCLRYGRKKSKLALLVITFAMPLALFVVSYGAFLILREAPFNGRSLIGVGAALAVLAIIPLAIADKDGVLHIITKLTVGVTVYSFVVYGLAFGNGLADQKEYAMFRIQYLIGQLSHSDLNVGDDKKYINLSGDIGLSPVMLHVESQYPVTNVIFDIQSGLNDKSVWGYRWLVDYYGVKLIPEMSNTLNCSGEVSSTQFYDISKNDSGDVCVKIK